ncbi:MAG: choice-of-anchor H family protein [Proteobacteria bacterium]|nr:choice-of-anchor H family protein [Pseudomonadota bacterium]
MKTRTRNTNSAFDGLVWYLSLAMLLMSGASISRADHGGEQRLSVTVQGQGSERSVAGGDSVSYDEFEPLLTSGARARTTRATGQQKTTNSESEAPNVEFWFYDVSVQLFSDFDHDGYYYGIDLAFDADTQYTVADVYAVIYLSFEFGPWNEYAATENFKIFGASGDDEYFVQSELISGYPTGHYDILIELFDAYDDAFVASIGPDETSKLSVLPLEDAARDAPIVTTVVIDTGGGGSLGWLTLLMLAGIAGFTRGSVGPYA